MKLLSITPRLSISFVLVIVWLAFLENIFGEEYSFSVFVDNESFLAPVLSHMSDVIRHGEWPLWMNTVLGGVPLYNFTQLSPFYPFYLIELPIFENSFEAMRSMHLIILGHLLLFQINTYLFLRGLRVSRLAAVAGASLVVFNANTMGYTTWLNIIAPYAWFPLYLLGLIKLLDEPASHRAMLISIFAIVMLVLASPAQPFIHAIFMTAVLYIFHAVRLRRTKERERLCNGTMSLMLVAFVALLLVSPVLIPAIIEYKDMVRWVGPFPPVIGNARIPFEAFLTDQISIDRLPGVLFPMGGSQAIGSVFVGLLPILLAMMAFPRKNASWFLAPFVFVAIYSLVSSTGSNLGLAYLNYHLPLINKIREPSRFLFLFHFSIGILAAIGLDRIAQLIRDGNSISREAYCIRRMYGALTIFFLAAAILWTHITDHTAVLADFLVAAAMIAITTLAFTKGWGHKSKIILGAWVAAVIVTQILLVPWKAPLVANSDYLTQNKIELDAAIRRISELDPKHEYRIIFGGNINKQTAAMFASYQGVRTLNSYFNPAPRRQFDELYYHGPRKDNYARGLGAKYLICMDCAPNELEGYVHAEDVGKYSIFEAKDALPHTYIASSVAGVFHDLGDYANKLSMLTLSSLPLFIEQGVKIDIDNTQNVSSICLKKVLREEFNRVELVTECNKNIVFVLNEYFSPNWQVRVDGKLQKSLRVNGNQVGVPVAAGSHVIDFRYSPWIFTICLAFMIGGFVMTVSLFRNINKA